MTVWARVPVLVLKLVSPLKEALIVSLPAANGDDVVNVATPPLKIPVPIDVEPTEKVTVPVGVPLPGALAVTVAVKVTACP